MKKETYYEESSIPLKSAKEEKLYKIFHVVSIIFLVISLLQIPLALELIMVGVNSYLHPTEGAEPVTLGGLLFTIFSWVFFILLCLGAFLIFFFIKRRFNVSYDYIFVEDELRVSKVLNGKKRKFLKSFKMDQVLKMGRCSGESFERTCAGMSKKSIRFLTSNREPAEGKDFYYLLYSTSIEKSVYIVESRPELIDYLVFAAGRQKWESR